MRKILILTFILFTMLPASMAQSSPMTDEQVMQFVLTEHNAGTSQGQIVTKLMKKGVDINQIRRVRQKYEKQIKTQGAGALADEAVDKADKIMRTNNEKQHQRLRDTRSTGRDTSKEGTELETEETAMTDEITSLYPNQIQPEEALYKGSRVFGRDIFNNTELTFEPAMNIATPRNYVVGPGDNVKVDIYGASQKSEVYTVSPDGDITIEGYGPINISGLTIEQANARLRSTLGSRYSSSSIKMS